MEMKKQNIIARCPICESELIVSELKCTNCETIIKNDFKLSPFFKLNKEEQFLLLTLVKYLGNLSQIAKELGISYPTLRNKLENLRHKLRIKTEGSKDRSEILEKIEKGEITVNKAIKLLKNI